MRRFKTLTASLGAAGMILLPIAAQADEARQLIDINGMYASDAESALRNRGFEFISHNRNSRGYNYSYWWDGSDKSCVQVEEYNGRIETINDATRQDCGHHTGGGGGAAAALLGAVIIGAAASHSSNHHEDNRHHEDEERERQFERGYNDGLHNASYHNRNNHDGYADGYAAGVDERNANLRDHHGRGGYNQTAQFSDLQGARAAGGMDELERRGFEQVDNFTSGNTRYSIQWREQSRQCLQVTIADGHFYDIRDIGQNPNCR